MLTQFRCLLLTVILNTAAVAQVGTEVPASTGAASGDYYQMESVHGYPAYLMLVELEAESNPDSEVEFHSRGQMAILKTQQYRQESLSIDPEFVIDNRLLGLPLDPENASLRLALPAFSRVEKRNRMFAGSRCFDLLGRDGEPLGSAVESDTKRRRRSQDVLETMVVDLFEWPIRMPGSGGEHEEYDEIDAIFGGKDYECVKAISAGGLLETHWMLTSRKYPFVAVVTFKNDLVVRNTMYWVKMAAGEKNYDLKKAQLLGDVQTKWVAKGDGKVPSEVAYFSKPGVGRGAENGPTLSINAKIAVSLPGEKQYEDAKALADQVFSKLPEREIAGAEQAKADDSAKAK